MSISGISDLMLDSYDYLSMKKSLKKGERSTIRLTPISGDNTFGYGNNAVIMFDIPYIKGSFWDLKNTSLQFTGAISGSGSQGFNNLIESVINRFQVFLADGTSEIETINYYNLKANALLKYKISEDYKNTIAFEQWGVADQATRLQWATGRDYAVNLIGSGLMSTPLKYLPLNLLSKNNFSRSLRIEITLENPNLCMFGASGSVLNYVLSNVFLQMDIIKMDSYNAELEMKINNKEMNLAIPFCTSHTWQNTILNGESGRINLSIQEYKQFMTGIMTLFTGATSITQEYTSNFVFPNLLNYQYLINNKYFPTKEIKLISGQGVSPSYNETMKFFNKMKEYAKSTTGSINKQDQFMITCDDSVTAGLISTTDIITLPENLLNNIVAGYQRITSPSNNLLMGANGIFNVLQSGFYNINASCVGISYNTVPTVNTMKWGMQLYTLTGVATYAPVLPGPVANTSLLNGSAVVPVTTTLLSTSPQNTIGFNGLVYLSTGVNYVLGGYQFGTITVGNNVDVQMVNMSLSYVSGATVADSRDFVIGQTLRNFYDLDEHMGNMGEYLLDGMDVRTPSTINLNIGTPNLSQVQMFHFVEYTCAIVIDNEKVVVIA